MKTVKLLYICTTVAIAAMMAVACHEDDYDANAHRFNDGKIHFAVGTQDQWKAETRAGQSRVDFVNIDQTMDDDSLLVVIEDNLMGDTLKAEEPTTRGQRYTSEGDDAANDERTWSGTGSGQHRMHESFAIMGLKYSDNFSFSGSTIWTDLSDQDIKEVDEDYCYCVLTRPSSPETDGIYEIWDWDSSGKGDTNWPSEGNVFLFACAPSPTDDAYGIDYRAKNNSAPYIDYVVPEAVTLQPDLMIAKRKMTHSQILATHKDNVSNDPIKLDFQHVCTAVKFRLAGDTNTGTGNSSLKIKKITLKNVVSQARFTYDATETRHTSTTTEIEAMEQALTNSWSTTGKEPNYNGLQRSDLTYDFGSDLYWTESDKTVKEKTITKDDNVFMMIPQKFTAKDGDNPLQINITCIKSDNTEFTLTVVIDKVHAWRPGHVVIYTIAKVDEVNLYPPVFNVTVDGNSSTTATMEGKNISYNVESYQPYSIGTDTRQMPIPWEIIQAQMYLKEGSTLTPTQNYLDGNIPELLSMDTKVVDDVTGKPKDKTWGNGGHPETVQASINKSKRRAGNIFTSNAMRRVVNRNTYGTPESRQDLSMLGLNGAPTETRNTANCYVVSAAGYYAIPLVYGNAIEDGIDNQEAYTPKTTAESAKLTDESLGIFVDHLGNPIGGPWITDTYTPTQAFVLWQTSKDLVTGVTLKDTLDLVTNTTRKFLFFNVTPEDINLGNAVIAIADASSNIIWSWHIWVNDYDEVSKPIKVTAPAEGGIPAEDYEFMEVNLGWTDGYKETLRDSVCTVTFHQKDTGKSDIEITLTRNGGDKDMVYGTGGTYYQHGRKDPFPSVSIDPSRTNSQDDGEGHTLHPYAAYDMLENKSTYLFDWDGSHGHPVDVDKTTTNVKLKDGICNPNLLYLPPSSTNWFNKIEDPLNTKGYYDNLWSSVPYLMDEYGAEMNIHDDIVKTIYDPCPIGYCVPNPGAFKAFWTKKTFDNQLREVYESGSLSYYYYENYFCYDYLPTNSKHPGEGLPTTINGDPNDLNFKIYGHNWQETAPYPNDPYDENEIHPGTTNTLVASLISGLNGLDTAEGVINAATNDLANNEYSIYRVEYLNNKYVGVPDGNDALSTHTEWKNTQEHLHSTGDFAHAKSSISWKPTETTNSASPLYKFNGVEGLLYNDGGNTLFFPSAGMRNPKKEGLTQQGSHETFNFGGYYATAFATPSGDKAATFFWIQRKGLHDGEDNKLIGVNDVPLFDPYNRLFPEEGKPKIDEVHGVKIYRKHTGNFNGGVSLLGINISFDYWDAANIYGVANLSGNYPSIHIPLVGNISFDNLYGSVIPRFNKDRAEHCVKVHFYKKFGPKPYETEEWGRDRTYGMSVRPIIDKGFPGSVGIKVTNSGGSSYRDTRASRRRR